MDALREAKAAIAEFREIATVALSEAGSEVQRTLGWLQNDARTRWEHEVRRRREKVTQARSDLERAKLAAMDDRAACTEQRRGLERAERRLAEAERGVEAVRRWARMLDREMMLFRGRLQPLARTVEGDLPRGEARLDHLLERLEAYLRVAPPAGAPGAHEAPAEIEAEPEPPAETPGEAPESDRWG